LSQSTRLTDRQIDGQTDRILIARPRLHSMQRGKNEASEKEKDGETAYIAQREVVRKDLKHGGTLVGRAIKFLDPGAAYTRSAAS